MAYISYSWIKDHIPVVISVRHICRAWFVRPSIVAIQTVPVKINSWKIQRKKKGYTVERDRGREHASNGGGKCTGGGRKEGGRRDTQGDGSREK